MTSIDENKKEENVNLAYVVATLQEIIPSE